jgi:hypothetical protein
MRGTGIYSAAFRIVPYQQSNHSYGTVPTGTSFKDLLSFYREAMKKDFFRKRNFSAVAGGKSGSHV